MRAFGKSPGDERTCGIQLQHAKAGSPWTVGWAMHRKDPAQIGVSFLWWRRCTAQLAACSKLGMQHCGMEEP